MAVDIGASVIALLKNKAKETGKPLQLYLQLFSQDFLDDDTLKRLYGLK